MSESPPAKNAKSGKESRKPKQKAQKPNKKEKPRGKIIDVASPSREVEHISSSESSDSEEERRPLASFLRQEDSFSMPQGNFSDLSDIEAEDLTNVGRLLSKTISSVNNATDVSCCLSCIPGL